MSDTVKTAEQQAVNVSEPETAPTALALVLNAGKTPILASNVAERHFKSGSRGFYANGKAIINGRNYQCSVTLTEIGSKPKA